MSNSRRRRRVAAAVKAIKAFYALGRELPPKVPHKDSYREFVIAAEAATRDVNTDVLRKARQFSNAADGYTRAELDALCRLVADIQPTQAAGLAVFGRTHVMRLLGVPRTRRPALQRTAVKQGWSVRELEAAIAARFGPRTAGGRKPKRPASVTDLLVHLERTCERWRRWVAAVSTDTGAKGSPPTTAALTPRIQKRVLAMTAVCHDLQTAVAGELARHASRRASRRPPAREE